MLESIIDHSCFFFFFFTVRQSGSQVYRSTSSKGIEYHALYILFFMNPGPHIQMSSFPLFLVRDQMEKM